MFCGNDGSVVGDSKTFGVANWNVCQLKSSIFHSGNHSHSIYVALL